MVSGSVCTRQAGYYRRGWEGEAVVMDSIRRSGFCRCSRPNIRCNASCKHRQAGSWETLDCHCDRDGSEGRIVGFAFPSMHHEDPIKVHFPFS